MRLHPIGMDQISYLGLPHCLRLRNADAELVVSTDVGPRVLRYALNGGENAFGEYPEKATQTSLGAWKPYAGQRLWAAPELFPGTYAPDNAPIEHDTTGERSVRLKQPQDAAGLRKTMAITLAEQGSGVTAEYAITNGNLWPVTIAPWSIAALHGGVSVLPREPHRSHDDSVAVAQPLSLYYFTDLQDPRYTLGQRYILLRADAQRAGAQKIGIGNKREWCAHLSETSLLLKRFSYDAKATYPDDGSNTEAFTAGVYMELELLGPLETLQPGETTSFRESWQLYPGVKTDFTSEDAVHAAIAPYL